MTEGSRSGGSSGSGRSGEERMVCGHRRFAAGKWTLREETPKYAPDRTCDVEHLRLEATVDLPGRHLDCVCKQRLRAAYGPFDSITLDAVDLKIRSVRDGSGRDLSYSYLDRKLTVRFPEKVAESAELEISYEVDHPVLGLYFFGPTEDEPEATFQLWSQGEDEETRFWIPCHDAPHERMTTEMVITVEPRYTVLSNGALQEVTENVGRKTFHWLESVPHPSYLITLVVGEFVRVVDEWNGVPVDYYVEPGREEEARRSFGKTPRMIDFYSRKFGVPYPYEKYSQVAIRHFHFGGMENTSATSQTDGTLHDERAALDFTSDELVSHELVHQWFGDLLTCKSWAHAWLNEGFATYFEAVWKEEDLGREEFDYEMLANAASYMSEPYRRPIVTNRYAYPHDLFDMHLYPKGGWVLHMLRRRIGDETFWKAISLYTNRHARSGVETIDLIRAFEDASGKNLAGFFDQWVMSPGHAEVEGSAEWDAEGKRVKVALKQTQKTDDGTPVFHIPVRIECRTKSGGTVGQTFEMDRAEQTFYLPSDSEPVSFVIDPELAVLATWKVTRPVEWIEGTLLGDARDPRVAARVETVRQLAEKPTYKGEEILGRVLREDPFWGVQAQAARALARTRTPHARQILLEATGLPHPKARRAVVEGLGAFQSADVARSLTRIIEEGDRSYFVESAAASALGATRQPGAVETLRRALGKRTWHDLLTLGAVEGLAATRDESVVENLLAVANDRRRYWSCRLAAMRGLANLGAARPQLAPRIAEELIRFLEDPERLILERVRGPIVQLGHESGVAALHRAASATPDPRMANEYLMAAEELAGGRKRGEDIDRLRDELQKVRDEAKEMRELLHALQQKVDGQTPEGTGGGNGARPRAAAKEATKEEKRRRPETAPAKTSKKKTAAKGTKAAPKLPATPRRGDVPKERKRR